MKRSSALVAACAAVGLGLLLYDAEEPLPEEPFVFDERIGDWGFDFSQDYAAPYEIRLFIQGPFDARYGFVSHGSSLEGLTLDRVSIYVPANSFAPFDVQEGDDISPTARRIYVRSLLILKRYFLASPSTQECLLTTEGTIHSVFDACQVPYPDPSFVR